MPNPMVSLTGVPVRGFTSAHDSGTSPSRAIAKKIRVWPYRMTSSTLVIATKAPNAVSDAAQGNPAPASSASDIRLAPQPTAIAATDTPYSRIRSHPMIQATISPSVA